MDTALLGSISFLARLSQDELDILSDKFVLEDVLPGKRIVAEGAPIHSLYILCNGVVHVRRLAQEREVMVARISPGAFFGEMNLFEQGPATASVYAMEKSTLAVAEHEVLRECMADNPAMGYKIVSSIMTEMCRRLRETNNRLLSAYFWTGVSQGEPEA